MKSEFEIAITQLCSDRNLSPEVILEAIEAALVSAYKRNYGPNQAVTVSLDPHTGQARVFVNKVVSEQVEDDRRDISLAEARTIKADVVVGDSLDIELTPRNFGRIAAQTAKQVIMQRIREAERDSVYLEFADRSGEIVNGVVRNVDARTQNVTVSLGKAEAILPKGEQIPGEHYRFGQRLRVYISEVDRSGHGPQITVSRTHRGLLRRLLELEVPEIYNGTVEIKGIAREPGSRSKVAVSAVQPGVDPVGSCVGMRGVRIQNIVNELNGEKIDVVAWASEVEGLIANALSPAKVVSVHLIEADKTAQVVVPDRSLSLAIGKEGQNARLAAKLTGWRIDIRSESEAAQDAERLAAEQFVLTQQAQELEAARKAAAELLAEAQAALEAEEGIATQPAVEVVAEQPVAPVQELPVGLVASEPEIGLEAQPPVAESVTPEPVVIAEEPEVFAAPVVETVIEAAPAGVVEVGLAQPSPVDASVVVAQPEAAAVPEPEIAGPAEEEVAEEEEQLEDLDKADKKGPGKKDRGRRLEFDERLGRVVAKKTRKPSRRTTWEAGDEDDWTG